MEFLAERTPQRQHELPAAGMSALDVGTSVLRLLEQTAANKEGSAWTFWPHGGGGGGFNWPIFLKNFLADVGAYARADKQAGRASRARGAGAAAGARAAACPAGLPSFKAAGWSIRRGCTASF
jgi:hypothetical protein